MVTPERRRVLVVEDTADIRELLAEILSSEGYDVTVASHGAEALDELHKGRFDIILLDLMMPIMNGFELLTRLADSALGHPPIVAMSAFERFRGEARGLGAESFLSKPVDVDRLLQEVERVISLHQHVAGAARVSALERPESKSPDGTAEEVVRRLEGWLDVARVSYCPVAKLRPGSKLSMLVLGDASTEETLPGGLYVRLQARHHGHDVGLLELADDDVRDFLGEELALAQYVANILGSREDAELGSLGVDLATDTWGESFADCFANAMVGRCRRDRLSCAVAVACLDPSDALTPRQRMDRMRAAVGVHAHLGWLRPSEVLVVSRAAEGAAEGVLHWAEHLEESWEHEPVGAFALGLILTEAGSSPLASEALRRAADAAHRVREESGRGIERVSVKGYPAPWLEPSSETRH